MGFGDRSSVGLEFFDHFEPSTTIAWTQGGWNLSDEAHCLVRITTIAEMRKWMSCEQWSRGRGACYVHFSIEDSSQFDENRSYALETVASQAKAQIQKNIVQRREQGKLRPEEQGAETPQVSEEEDGENKDETPPLDSTGCPILAPAAPCEKPDVGMHVRLPDSDHVIRITQMTKFYSGAHGNGGWRISGRDVYTDELRVFTVRGKQKLEQVDVVHLRYPLSFVDEAKIEVIAPNGVLVAFKRPDDFPTVEEFPEQDVSAYHLQVTFVSDREPFVGNLFLIE